MPAKKIEVAAFLDQVYKTTGIGAGRIAGIDLEPGKAVVHVYKLNSEGRKYVEGDDVAMESVEWPIGYAPT